MVDDSKDMLVVALSWAIRRSEAAAEATTVCPELFTERCNHHETWREHQWCRLACWENGVGYETQLHSSTPEAIDSFLLNTTRLLEAKHPVSET